LNGQEKYKFSEDNEVFEDHPYIFFPLFQLVNTSPMERIKKAALLGDLLFSE
jgi:hypothetical protein